MSRVTKHYEQVFRFGDRYLAYKRFQFEEKDIFNFEFYIELSIS